ncbi:hypothetical protein [Roseimicrobium sp. ORNL1]|uniref:hypothetical protein n=1 Tax=Roseimicrobium sp. ORNL1 TaxID=2711231 RepID=UPI0013E19F8B|nr:hypothetical protein [Roseimicrobium sp. ORNL1]QIF02426.1 hypothetical protein G5S37_13130 [Roseimicrobium sp. ORNL1]
MDSSKTPEQIIELGKALVATLEAEGIDTLSAWMAHYIAELMEAADKPGEDRADAQERCFEAILRLWKHRASMPSGRRPFEAFDVIIQTLDRLNPDDPRTYYFEMWRRRGPKDSSDEKKDAVEKMLEVAMAADRAARIVIQYLISVAVDGRIDDLTRTLLKNAVGDEDALDVDAYNKLIADLAAGKADFGAKERDALKRKIEQLDLFLKLGQGVREMLVGTVGASEPSNLADSKLD